MRRVQSMIWKMPDEIGKEIFGMQLNDTEIGRAHV